MKKPHTWYKDQERNTNKTFKPKWTKEIILGIIEDVNKMTPFIDIQYALVKKHNISIDTTDKWIPMAMRIMKDMNNGLSFEDASERDKERRNLMRRKKPLEKTTP